MKTYKVYEIYNFYGSVEDVGETHRTPENRLWEKTHPKKSKFYGRRDLLIHVVAEFNNRKDALELEGQLKLEYGLRWGEKHGSPNGGYANGGKGGKISGIMNRKLTLKQAEEIRNSNCKNVELAKKYGVSPSTIGAIKKNRTYAC